MSEPSVSMAGSRIAEAPEQRSGGDRRRGADRRVIDLWQLMGRPGFDPRSGVERRSGRDRRDRASSTWEPEAPGPPVTEIVTPWQIAEPRG